MLNEVRIIGRLGKQPKLENSKGVTYATLNVAVDRSYKDKKSGEWVERTDWHYITVFDKQAEKCATYPKGGLVLIAGELRNSTWTGEDGQDYIKTEVGAQRVRLLDRKTSTQPNSADDQYPEDVPF